jgi:predicted DNA-binding ribbon-helix-helix protein
MGRSASDIAVTSVKIERQKLDALKKIAERDRRNVSQQIRWLIDRCVEEDAEPEEIAA